MRMRRYILRYLARFINRVQYVGCAVMAAYSTPHKGEKRKQPPRRFIFPSPTATSADAAQNGIIVKVHEDVWEEFRREDVEPEMIINPRGRLGLHSNAESINNAPLFITSTGPCSLL